VRVGRGCEGGEGVRVGRGGRVGRGCEGGEVRVGVVLSFHRAVKILLNVQQTVFILNHM